MINKKIKKTVGSPTISWWYKLEFCKFVNVVHETKHTSSNRLETALTASADNCSLCRRNHRRQNHALQVQQYVPPAFHTIQ